MVQILRDINNLRYCCLKKRVFNFERTHYFLKLIQCYRTVSFIHLCPFFPYFLFSLLIFKDDFAQTLNINTLLFFFYRFGLSYKFLHLFHKLFCKKALLTCRLGCIKEIDYHYLDLLIM